MRLAHAAASRSGLPLAFFSRSILRSSAATSSSGRPRRLSTASHTRCSSSSAGTEHLAALAKEAGFDESRTLAKRLLLLLEGAAATAAMRRSREPIGVARSLARELLDVRPR